MAPVEITLAESLAGVDPRAWDALAGDDDPFIEHRFLRALETSGSVGAGTGWEPCHVLVHDGGRLVGAMPLYLKTQSYGEYIFDWGWANAAHRAGLDYYPKLVSAVPFTPATGRRLLIRDASVVPALVAGAHAAAEATDASSIHVLFPTLGEVEALAASHGFLPRLSMQFHWESGGWASFEDFLGALRQPARRQIRSERRQAADSGLDFRVVRGTELDDAAWAALDLFYRDTADKKGAIPYLTPAFLAEVRRSMPERLIAALATDGGGRPVAGAFGFQKGRHLYGRYWGTLSPHPALHFELCYYRLIERCLAEGWTRFEAGAQGEHKLKRGLLPTATHSAHWLRDPGLRDAVARWLPQEAAAVRREMAELSTHTPFKRG